jgi:hypothetical protein
MDLTHPIRVYYGRNRKLNLYIYHPMYYTWGDTRKAANQNRVLVNWVRKTFPHIANEVREIPTAYDKYGSCYGRDHVFCFYGLTKQEYMMLKLSWTFREFRMSGRKPTSHTRRIDYVSPYHRKPSLECQKRFEKPGYKPKPLKILD